MMDYIRQGDNHELYRDYPLESCTMFNQYLTLHPLQSRDYTLDSRKI